MAGLARIRRSHLRGGTVQVRHPHAVEIAAETRHLGGKPVAARLDGDVVCVERGFGQDRFGRQGRLRLNLQIGKRREDRALRSLGAAGADKRERHGEG